MVSTSTTIRTLTRPRWRVVDIVVASVLAVACGVIFWLWAMAWTPLSNLLAFLAPLSGLLAGGWLIAGVIGGLVIRKPGAAVFCELVAAGVEATLGTHWGMTVFIWGLIQGIGAEIAFALFGYRRFTLPVAMVSGGIAGVASGLLDVFVGSYVTWEVGYKAIYVGCTTLSGVLLAGVVAWLAVRALAATGALAPFAAGRSAREV